MKIKRRTLSRKHQSQRIKGPENKCKSTAPKSMSEQQPSPTYQSHLVQSYHHHHHNPNPWKYALFLSVIP